MSDYGQSVENHRANGVHVMAQPPIKTSLIDGATTYPKPARAKDTVYQNTSGRTILVNIVCTVGNPGSYSLYVENANPPTILRAYDGNTNQYANPSVPVPNGWYYKLTTTGTLTLQEWSEL